MDFGKVGMELPPLQEHPDTALEPTPKWIRAYKDGQLVVDSKQAMMVRPPAGPPRTYAFPPEDIQGDVPPEACMDIDGHVAIQWGAVDTWMEEGEEVFFHPRDPKKRIDVLRSPRHVVIEHDGQVVADSHQPVLLFEDVPHLPVRYYLPFDDVRMDLMTPSKTQSGCPYKGIADYWSLDDAPDIAWTYRRPLREVEPIRGLVAFFTERVDLILDGEPQERPNSPFA